MHLWDLANGRIVLGAHLQPIDDLVGVLPVLQEAKGLRKGDLANDVECIPLKPFPHVDRPAGEVGHRVDELSFCQNLVGWVDRQPL